MTFARVVDGPGWDTARHAGGFVFKQLKLAVALRDGDHFAFDGASIGHCASGLQGVSAEDAVGGNALRGYLVGHTSSDLVNYVKKQLKEKGHVQMGARSNRGEPARYDRSGRKLS